LSLKTFLSLSVLGLFQTSGLAFYQSDKTISHNSELIAKNCQRSDLSQSQKSTCYQAATKTYERYLSAVLNTEAPLLKTYIQSQYSKFVHVTIHSYTMNPTSALDGADYTFDRGATGLFASLQGHRKDNVQLQDIKGREWIEDTTLITNIAQGFGDKVILTGFSLGGLLSIEQANTRPEMVAGYMAMAPSFHGGPALPHSEKSCFARIGLIRKAVETVSGQNLSSDFILGGCAIFRVSRAIVKNIQNKSFRKGDWTTRSFERNYLSAKKQLKSLTMPGVIIHSQADQVVSHQVNDIVTGLLTEVASQNFIFKKYNRSGPRHWGDHIYYSNQLSFSGYDGLDHLFTKLSD